MKVKKPRSDNGLRSRNLVIPVTEQEAALLERRRAAAEKAWRRTPGNEGYALSMSAYIRGSAGADNTVASAGLIAAVRSYAEARKRRVEADRAVIEARMSDGGLWDAMMARKDADRELEDACALIVDVAVAVFDIEDSVA